jgi:hypothetical protein
MRASLHRIKIAESAKIPQICSDNLLLPPTGQGKAQVIDRQTPRIFSFDFNKWTSAKTSIGQAAAK